jgi:hypothetical protein
MPDTFLTESRREVLEGDWSGVESTERSKKSHIRTRARSAVGELIEVARSEEINNADVFEPAEVGTLLYWILNDPSETHEVEGLIEGDGDDVESEYRQRVAGEASGPILSVHQRDDS